MILLYAFGFLRTVLIIIGVIVVIRLLGQFMTARRNIEEERELNRKQQKQDKEIDNLRKNFGKTTISKIDSDGDQGEYADYEEIKE